MFRNISYQIVQEDFILDKIFRLRYDIYVHECGFIPAANLKEEKETDKFDGHSIHIAALDKNGQLIGAVRLVKDSKYGFPLEERCKYPILSKYLGISRKNTLEISRLVTARKYRASSNSNHYSRKITPIIFGLYSVAYQESLRLGVTHWIAAMEESLFKLVNNHGFIFRAIGEPIEYFGQVIPYIGELETIDSKVQSQKHSHEHHILEIINTLI